MMSESKKKQKPVIKKCQKEMEIYDYELGALRFLLMSGNFAWETRENETKKVILVNPKDCEKKITLSSMMAAWRGTGHTEWEAILAGLFVNAVVEALSKDEEAADITNVFNRDYKAVGGRRFTKEQVYDHLIKWFDIVEETETTLKLKLRIEA